MKNNILLSVGCFILLLFFLFGCPTNLDTSGGGSTNLPVKTIEWVDDGTGFRQYYTNDTAKYNNSPQHLSYYSETMDTVELQIKKMGGSVNNGFGIVFCYNDYNNYYQLIITVNGYYRISKRVNGVYSYNFNDGNGWGSSNKSWPYNEYIKTGYGALNDIKIQRVSNIFTVTFNTQVVFSFIDDSFTSGAAGCILGVGNSINESFPNTPADVRYKMITTKPITSIYWQDDINGFTQYYTNDSQYYQTGGVHSLGTIFNPMHTAEIQVKKMSGNPDVGYGMAFCYQDNYNYYQLIIVVNGYYRIGRIVAGVWNYYLGGTWTTISGQWPSSTNLNMGYGNVNDIKVARDATGTFSIYFNNTLETTFTDSSFTGGDSGYIYSVASQSYEGFPGNPVDYRFKLITAD